jgi:DNA-binding transcriptional regulator GbsR (MarR family)
MLLIKHRPMTVTELVGALGISRGVVYYHTKNIPMVKSRLRGTKLEFWIGERDETTPST